jgi:AraC-like DNA-binding protein
MRLRKNQPSPIELASGVISARYFCLTHENDQKDFQYLGGFEQCDAHFDLQRDAFPFLTLEIIVGGEGELTLGEKKHPLKAGCCFCTGPAVSFRIQSNQKNPLQKYFLVFGRDTQPRKSHPDAFYPGCIYRDCDTEALIRWSELILEEGASQHSEAAEIVESLITILARKISNPNEGLSHERRNDARVTNALREIDRSFQSIHTIKELAEILGITREHLCRCFQRSGKASPYKILMRRKLEHAYTQLKLSSMTIQEIALSLGFADAFQFSRAFKKKYGRPPSSVRAA